MLKWIKKQYGLLFNKKTNIKAGYYDKELLKAFNKGSTFEKFAEIKEVPNSKNESGWNFRYKQR